MNKINKIVCISLAALLLIIIGFNYYRDNLVPRTLPIRRYKPIEPINNNDFVENEVIIGFYDNAKELDIENYIYNLPAVIYYESLIDGESYVLTIDHNFNSRSDLNRYCNSIKDKYIEYCEANNIYKLDDCSKGPC